MATKITWRQHIWALAIFACLLASLLIQNFLTNKINLFSFFFFIPRSILIAFVVVEIIIAIVLFSKHVFFHNKEKNNVEMFCYILGFTICLLAFIDRVVLGAASDIALATVASSQKNLTFFSTMVYLVQNNFKTFYTGIFHTLELAFFGTIIGFVIAMLLVFCRISKADKRDSEFMQALKLTGNAFASFYVTIIRGTPMMVQGLIIYYAGFRFVRALFPNMSVSELNGIYSIFLASAVTVSLNTAAYITEILRGSVESIDKGQVEAARSLGLSNWQTMYKVIFPQAIRNSIPAICNEFIINIKDTSVLNAVGMTELMFMTTTVAGTYYVYLETYMITAVVYLVLTICMQALMNFVAKRMDMPVQHGVPSSN